MNSSAVITLPNSLRSSATAFCYRKVSCGVVTCCKVFISCVLLSSPYFSASAMAQSDRSKPSQQQILGSPLEGIALISVDTAFARAVLKSDKTGIALVAKGQLFPATTIRVTRVFDDKIEFEAVSAGDNPEKLHGYLYKSVNGKSELSWITVKAPPPQETSLITTVEVPGNPFTKK
jgi:hypothetical protein